MNLKRKTLIPAGLLILTVLATTLLLLFKGEKKAPHEPNLKVLSDKVDAQIKDVLYTEIGDGDLKWEIKADTVRYVKKENLAIFENVAVRLVAAGGRTFIMTGDRGEYSTDKKDIRIFGNVRVITDRNDTFSTEHLRYTNADKSITTDAPIVMKNDLMQISGRGMTLSLKKRELSVLAQVKARIR